ncbi:MAG: PAS domain-containing sensor histidine kinase [Caldilineae bacterium]|nr:MAG: PAS domain-containing sensor histidine kinase [Caldilineae bacterium]
MPTQLWREAVPARRVHWLRWTLPFLFAAIVVFYQMLFTTYIHNRVGETAHTLVEIGFYSVVGPVFTWLTLGLIGRWLREREALEQTARAQEQHLASIVNASADAILSLDAQGCIRTWNRGAESMFGYPAEEVVGRPLSMLLAGEPSTLAPFDPSQPLQNYETACRTRGGRTISVEATLTPLQTAGTFGGASVILRDISQRKAREQLLSEERARIARDLHDGLAQNLYFMGLKLDYIRKRLDGNPDEAGRELAMLKQTVQHAIREVRRTIFALRPLDLQDKDLDEAIVAYAQAFAEQVGLRIETSVTSAARRIPPSLHPTLFRVMQESLNNVAKHADARRVSIRLSVEGEVCRLEISDDGRGFDPENQVIAARHLGLRQMQERVAESGGELHIRSQARAGTTVSAVLPLRGSP